MILARTCTLDGTLQCHDIVICCFLYFTSHNYESGQQTRSSHEANQLFEKIELRTTLHDIVIKK